MPNQDARIKDTVKSEKNIKDDEDLTYRVVDEFLQEVIRSSNIYETEEHVKNEIQQQHIMLMQHSI
jgi:peroxiredoxin